MNPIKIFGLLASALVAALLATGCQNAQVKRIEPTAAPVPFSTYAWGDPALSDAPDVSAQMVELDQEVRMAVGGQLQARGYHRVEDPARADMVVDYQVALLQEEFSGDPSDPSWDAQFDSNAPEGVVELPARTGAPRIVLSLGIGRQGQPALWGGSATKLLVRPESRDERRRVIGAAVRNLLQDLPATR